MKTTKQWAIAVVAAIMVAAVGGSAFAQQMQEMASGQNNVGGRQLVKSSYSPEPDWLYQTPATKSGLFVVAGSGLWATEGGLWGSRRAAENAGYSKFGAILERELVNTARYHTAIAASSNKVLSAEVIAQELTAWFSKQKIVGLVPKAWYTRQYLEADGVTNSYETFVLMEVSRRQVAKVLSEFSDEYFSNDCFEDDFDEYFETGYESGVEDTAQDTSPRNSPMQTVVPAESATSKARDFFGGDLVMDFRVTMDTNR